MNPVKSIVNGVLDASVFFSFDASGYRRHSQQFETSDLDVDLSGRVVAVTGANGGLGLAASRAFAARSAATWLIVRNRERGEAAASSLRREFPDAEIQVGVADMSDLESVKHFTDNFEPPRVDALIHNAGALVNARTTTADGLELTCATHLAGPYLLTRLLEAKLEAAQQGRIIWVSSGGMYTQKLDVGKLFDPPERFNGTTAYAQAKRAQVVVSESLADEYSYSSGKITSNAMHPGWAKTPGVSEALPQFNQMMSSRLRSPEQGADTIVWLAAAPRIAETTGQFFLDRQARKTHYIPTTRESDSERTRLIRELDLAVRQR